MVVGLTTVKVKKGNYGFYLQFTIYNADGTAKDLTGFTVKMKVRKGDGTLLFTRDGEVVDANNGVCRFLIQNGDFSVAGVYDAEVEIVGLGYVEDTETFKLQVLETVG